MRVLFLASCWPSRRHTTRAANLVLHHLMEATRTLGHKVGLAYCRQAFAPADASIEAPVEELREAGFAFAGDYSARLLAPPATDASLSGRLLAVRRAFLSRDGDDPRFDDPGAVVSEIKAFGPDLCVLFWDTSFEFLLPYLDGVACVGYAAKERHASTLAGLAATGVASPRQAADRLLTGRALGKAVGRHLERMRRLTALSNICRLDAAAYEAQGLPCAYVPNTFPDLFGQRPSPPVPDAPFEILANIGRMDATGSAQGLEYLAEALLDRLEETLAGLDWRITLCGGGSLPVRAARLSRYPRVLVAGYVQDLEARMAASHLFLMLNNTGPHTGGYTRIIYAFSAGTCLVAHRRLADSMPEVIHGQNALLGDTPEALAALVGRAARDPGLRGELGRAARRAYESEYAPGVVARRLLGLAEGRLA